MQMHRDAVRKKARQLGGMTKAVGKWALQRPEMMRVTWKACMVPALTFAQEVLCLGPELEQELDRVQREIGIRAMGGNRLVAQEGLTGEFACAPFGVREMRAKMAFVGRLRYMDGDRWARKVYKYVGSHGLRTMWEERVKRIERWKGVEWRGLQDETVGQWTQREKKEVEWRFENEWRWRMTQKTSLIAYRTREQMTWDNIYDGSYGSDLLFRARTGCLETGRRMRWQEGASQECRLCGAVMEDVPHVILYCPALDGIRAQVGWPGSGAEHTEGEISEIRKRLGIGREVEPNRAWIKLAERVLVSWRKLGGGR